jgi:hypothetical protein
VNRLTFPPVRVESIIGHQNYVVCLRRTSAKQSESDAARLLFDLLFRFPKEWLSPLAHIPDVKLDCGCPTLKNDMVAASLSPRWMLRTTRVVLSDTCNVPDLAKSRPEDALP